MQRQGSGDEVDECWTLVPEDLALLVDLPDVSKLGLAAQLAYWRQNGRFPDDEADLAPTGIGRLAEQIGVGRNALDDYDWIGRTGRRHRRIILGHLAVAVFDDAAEAVFRRWLADDLLPREQAREEYVKQTSGIPNFPNPSPDYPRVSLPIGMTVHETRNAVTEAQENLRFAINDADIIPRHISALSQERTAVSTPSSLHGGTSSA